MKTIKISRTNAGIADKASSHLQVNIGMTICNISNRILKFNAIKKSFT